MRVGRRPAMTNLAGKASTHLYLIRHGQPQEATGLCYGRTDLRVAPLEQARLLTDLPAQLPQGTPLFASPLQRCARLAHALAPLLNSPPPTLDARLTEMDFGRWEMQAWNDIPRTEIDAWAADVVDYRPGDGESVHQVARRVLEFWQALRLQAPPAVIIVAHAGTLRLLQACSEYFYATQIARHAAATPHQIGYGSVQHIEMIAPGSQGGLSNV